MGSNPAKAFTNDAKHRTRFDLIDDSGTAGSAQRQHSYSTYALNDTGYHNSAQAQAYDNLINDVYFNAGFVDPHAFNYNFSNKEIEVLMDENLLDTLDTFIDSYADIAVDDDDDIAFEFTQQDIDESFVRIPTPKTGHNENLIPIVLVGVVAVNGTYTTRPFVGLCDSGSSHTLINKQSLPHGTVTTRSPWARPTTNTTTQGSYNSYDSVDLEDITLPEFTNGRHVTGVTANVFDSPTCPYDILFSRDFLKAIKLKMDFDNDCVRWLDTIVDMKEIKFYDYIDKKKMPSDALNPNDVSNEEFLHHLSFFELEKGDILFDDLLFDDDSWESYAESFADEILERAYHEMSSKEVADQQTHLDDDQRRKLEEVLERHKVVFNGELGCYPHEKFHLTLKDDWKPFWQKAYPVPFAREKLFKEELQALVNDGVLEKVTTGSRFCSPTFVVPKKDGRIRWVSDFRTLNLMLKREPYPLPRIQDIMNRRGKYKWFTKIDLSMFFYSFELDDESKELCTINTPYGLY